MSTHARYSVRQLARRALARPDRREPAGNISEWLRQLLQCPRSEVEARARALARHGRAVLPECLAAGRPCGPETRRRLCLVFWLLGPAAGAAADLVAGWLPAPQAEAALLAMEQFGSPFLLDALAATAVPYPIWLDEPAVQRLCVLGSTPAVRALGGFGPARRQAIPFLAYLARQGCKTARETLMASGLPDALDVLMELECHRMQLFGDDGFLRIDSQQWLLTPQQCWIRKLQGFGNWPIPKAQIDLKRNPRRVQVSSYIHPNPPVKVFQADRRGLDGIESETVGFLELELSDFFKQLSADRRLGRAEAEQVQILRGSRRVLRLPENVKHGAFEVEAVSVAAQAEAEQQTLQCIPDQRLVVDHSPRLGKRQESRAYGGTRVPFHSMASR